MGHATDRGSERYTRGIATHRKVGGEGYDSAIKRLEETAPDLARLTVEFAYGDVMSRPVLDLGTRQLATVAALTGMANAGAQLRYHIHGALNVGCEPSAVLEAILLSTVYAGFPAALNGVFAAEEVFNDRGVAATAKTMAVAPEERYVRGLHTIDETSAGTGANVVDRLNHIAPDLGRFIVEFCYGDVISRPGINFRTRELATVALLTALGTAAQRSHRRRSQRRRFARRDRRSDSANGRLRRISSRAECHHGRDRGIRRPFLLIAFLSSERDQSRTVDAMRVRNKQITEHRSVANLFSLMQQLGALPGTPRT